MLLERGAKIGLEGTELGKARGQGLPVGGGGQQQAEACRRHVGSDRLQVL
jgi:hypothetical protein